jgi:hypothetical protein
VRHKETSNVFGRSLARCCPISVFVCGPVGLNDSSRLSSDGRVSPWVTNTRSRPGETVAALSLRKSVMTTLRSCPLDWAALETASSPDY